MSKFIPTKGHNPCPICEDTSGDCRINGDLILCHSFPDGGIDAPGYRFAHPSKDGVWGIYAPVQDNWTPIQKDHWQAEQRRKKQARLKTESEHYANGLSISERDKAIRAVAAYVGLNNRHREQLLARGLSPKAIEAGLYFSVSPNQPVPLNISDKLPGIGYHNGKKVLVSTINGYACVAFDDQGRAIGFQIRDENPNAKNKYRWAKGLFSSHLQNGELPLTVRGQGSTPWLTEAILKPDVTADRHGIRCIGAAGGNFLSSKSQLKQYLADCKEVIIAPDAGDIINPHTYQRWCKHIKYLTKIGITVQVAWWGQVTKDLNDIDELDSLDTVEYLNPEDWHRLAFKAKQQAKQKAEATQLWQTWITFSPDVTLHEQYLSGEALMRLYCQHKPKTIHIRSGLGTSKTGAVLEWLNQLRDNSGVIFMSDINRLLYQTVERANNIEGGIPVSHLHRDEAYDLVSSDEWLAACFQSLRRWKQDNFFDEKIIVLDEVCSIVRSLLDGDTMKGEGVQAKIVRKFQSLLQRASLVITLDGNLNDATVQLIDELRGEESLKILNVQPEPRHYCITRWDDEALTFELALMKLRAGLRVAVTSDNATKLRTFYEQVIQQGVLAREQIVIIDQNSTDEECPPRALNNPSQFWQQHPNKKLLLYSPAANRGFDIDGEALRDGIELFDVLLGIFEGIISPDQVDQQFFRLRSDKVERHLYLAPQGKPNPRPHSYRKQMDSYPDLMAVSNTPPEEIKKTLDAWAENPLVRYEDMMRAIANDTQPNFRERVLELLEAKNCTITLPTRVSGETTAASEDGIAIRREIRAAFREEQRTERQALATRIAIAPSNPLELDQLREQYPDQYRNVTIHDVTRRQKYEQALPGFTHSEQFTPKNIYLLEEKPEHIHALTFFTMLNYEEKAIAKTKKQLFEAVKLYQRTGFAWLGDIKTDALIIKSLNDLDTKALMQQLEGQPFTREAIQKWHAQASKKPYKTRLRGLISKDIMKSFRAVLKFLGFTLKTQGTGHYRRYLIQPMLSSDLHQQLLDSIGRKIRSEATPVVSWESLPNNRTDNPCSFIENRRHLFDSKPLPNKAYSQNCLDKKTVSVSPVNPTMAMPDSVLSNIADSELSFSA